MFNLNETAVGIPTPKCYEILLDHISIRDLGKPITIRYDVEECKEWEQSCRYSCPEEFRNQVSTVASLN